MSAPRPRPVIVIVACALALGAMSAACDDAASPDPHDTTDAGATDADTTGATDADTTDATTDTTSPLLAAPFDEPGPFSVGFRTLAHTYTPPNSTTPRTITLHLWYPTDATSGSPVLYEGLFPDPAALGDAPPAAPLASPGFPVHVHSHGHLGFGATSAFLMRHFASHGWVALAPSHTGNTLADNIDPRPAAIYHLRSSDITAALDAAESLPTSDPLAGLIDTSRVLLSGHSFGAHTTWITAGATFDPDLIEAACAESGDLFPCTPADRATFATFPPGLRDPRVVAIIPMAGTLRRELVGPSGHLPVTLPILAMSGSEDPVGADAQYTSTAGLELTWIDLAGACHQSFALGGCSTLADADAFTIVSAWAMAFARRHVLNDSTTRTLDLLSGTVPLSDKVTFMGPLR